MQLRLVILSIACFACLMPSALSFKLLAAKAVAGQAAGDVALIGANTIAAKKAAVKQAASDIASIAAQGAALKGQVLSTAAASMAGAAIKGAISLGGAIKKGGLKTIAAMLSGKPTLVYEPSVIAFQSPVLQDTIVEETVVREPVVVEYDQAIQIPPRTVSVDVMPQVWDIPAPSRPRQPLWTVNEAAPSFEFVGPSNSPYFYENFQTPQVYGPLMKNFLFGKK